MKRVTIAVALALSMLFGTSAFAGSKSMNIQLDTNFVSVHWSKQNHHHGKQHVRKPQHWQKRRVTRNKHRPRVQKRFHKPAARVHGQRNNKWQKRRAVKRVVRSYLWHKAQRYHQRQRQQQRRAWRHH
jgi:hypothetical protein